MTGRIMLPLDLLFPCYCVSCGNWVRSMDDHLCLKCRKELEVAEKGCDVCGGVLYGGKCRICSTRKFYPVKNITVYEYESCVKKVLYALKFGGVRNVVRNLIPGMVSSVLEHSLECDYITYVPMSRRKTAERGYNQSRLMAESIGMSLDIQCVPFLKEKQGHKPQRSLGNIERYINVIDRYYVFNINKLRDKKILLVDDIFTTGATINECSRQLLMHGASSVFSITAARADAGRI